ncbi:hypothetical protein BDZ90DRAFT_6564 [Jaminaea rosea]|uniref:Uncharacterized protein n=1 Tax=Jaminaea rosea TaxID=1569628 RepID=A0A316V408_9BASI|nr:hypothetical protein BDZ90DRAFT_6564 [Jaminaea rosea]PWN30185.1 hypothetical protein BDZ90DRAFT_6564 [Jaminaea rosea]
MTSDPISQHFRSPSIALALPKLPVLVPSPIMRGRGRAIYRVLHPLSLPPCAPFILLLFFLRHLIRPQFPRSFSSPSVHPTFQSDHPTTYSPLLGWPAYHACKSPV